MGKEKRDDHEDVFLFLLRHRLSLVIYTHLSPIENLAQYSHLVSVLVECCSSGKTLANFMRISHISVPTIVLLVSSRRGLARIMHGLKKRTFIAPREVERIILPHNGIQSV